MLKRKTYFGQIPVEVVKKTARVEVLDIGGLVLPLKKAKTKKAGRVSSGRAKSSCS